MRERSKIRALLPVAIAFALGSAVGAFFWLDLPKPSPAAAPPQDLVMLPRPQPPRFGPAAESPSHAASHASELDAFWAVLSEAEKEPVARAFASEFSRQPELREVYESFKRDRASPKAYNSLEALAKQLGSKQAFRTLVARFAQSPGFRDVAGRFMRFPEVRAALQDQTATLRAARGGARRRNSLAASASLHDASLQRGAEPARHTAARSSTGEAPPAAVLTAAAGPAAGALPGAGRASPPPSPGEEAHRVERWLTSAGGDDRDASAAISSLCYKDDPAITRAQCEAIEVYLGDAGLWESCVKAGLYETCRDLCARKPELKCGTVPNFYEVCIEAEAGRCRRRCNKIAGCTAPPPATTPSAPPESGGGTGGGTGLSEGTGKVEEPGCQTKTWEEEQIGNCLFGKETHSHYSCTAICRQGSQQPKECRLMYSSQNSCQ